MSLKQQIQLYESILIIYIVYLIHVSTTHVAILREMPLTKEGYVEILQTFVNSRDVKYQVLKTHGLKYAHKILYDALSCGGHMSGRNM